MPDFSHLTDIVRKVSPDVTVDEKSSPNAILVAAQDLIKVCTELHQNPETYFDMLSCVTGIDNGVQANTMEVVYNLYSIPFNTHLMLKVVLPRENPVIDSVISIWRTADWHEREAFDMLGIKFTGHPDMRRILMPADWEGFPLRKDYVHQEYYRDIKVKY
jgi:NADH-quinone oxidoreductase subunit C